MESVFLDTSVVVAYYLPEASSEHAQKLFGRVTVPAISGLVELEVVAALALRVRVGDLSQEMAEQALAEFDLHLDGGLYARLHLEPEHFRWARSAIARFDLPLKAPDALHVAAAQRDGLTLVTADRQLARNAEALGVAVDLIAP